MRVRLVKLIVAVIPDDRVVDDWRIWYPASMRSPLVNLLSMIARMFSYLLSRLSIQVSTGWTSQLLPLACFLIPGSIRARFPWSPSLLTRNTSRCGMTL